MLVASAPFAIGAYEGEILWGMFGFDLNDFFVMNCRMVVKNMIESMIV